MNTASVSSTQNPGPYTDDATDALVFPLVEVEPNNAGYATARVDTRSRSPTRC